MKDVLDTADMPSEYNSPIWRGHRPRADAAAVAWARAAGGVVIGKTVTTEFATRTPGPTANPHNPAHTPGGSSSGSAAGVAAGLFPLAFGTQTAGSIIRPAAFCGVVGYKPSFGTINRAGMKIMSESLDTIGAMARSVADCALLAGAVIGRDLGDPDAPARPRAAHRPLPLAELGQGARRRPRRCSTRVGAGLARAGAALEDARVARRLRRAGRGAPMVMNAESARSIGWELPRHRDGISPGLREQPGVRARA